jgi:predicted nucleotidyltransferase
MNSKTKVKSLTLTPLILEYLTEKKIDFEKDGIEKIGLFGSFAKGTASDDSDIDIAIKLKENYLENHDVWEYFKLVEKIKKQIADKFYKKSDIFDLDSHTDIREQIKKKVIYV